MATWADRCDNCHRDVISRYQLLGGRICNACYSGLRRNPARCPGCAEIRVLAHLDSGGARVCAACVGRVDRFGCRDCGSHQQLTGSQCGSCRLSERLAKLLDDGTGTVHERLQPLSDYLLAVKDPRTAVRWLKRESVADTLRGMAKGQLPVAHTTLDELPLSMKTRYFRRLLISANVLPEIDVFLNELELALARFLTTIPEEHARLIRRYHQWRTLPRLRQRAEPTSTGVFANHMRNVRLIAAFLAWLQEQHLHLSTMDQAVVDRYFAAASSRDVLGQFLTWAAGSGLCTRVEVPRVRGGPPQAAMSDEALAELAERVLADVALSPVGRLLALFAIVYAQPIRSSVELRLEAVEQDEGRVSIRFAATRVHLPATIAKLLQEHLEQLETRGSYHPIVNEWLFPGIVPGQHLAAGTGIGLLTRAGLSVRALRTSRLVLLSQTVPARVLADVIGISTQTAHARSIASGGTWQSYPELRRG